jgi:hypothetical protein
MAPPVHAGADWLVATARDPEAGRESFFLYAHDRTRTKTAPASSGDVADDATVKTVAGTRRDAAEAALHEWASDTLLVDGMLWRACPEPVLVYGFPRGFVVKAKFDDLFGQDLPSADAGEVFRLDQLYYAEKWMADAYAERGFDWRVASAPDIDVLAPGVLRSQTDERFLVKAANLLCQQMKRVDEAGAKAARDAMWACPTPVWDNSATPEQIAAFTGALESTIAMFLAGYDAKKGHGAARAADHCRKAIRRYDENATNLADGHDLLLGF